MKYMKQIKLSLFVLPFLLLACKTENNTQPNISETAYKFSEKYLMQLSSSWNWDSVSNYMYYEDPAKKEKHKPALMSLSKIYGSLGSLKQCEKWKHSLLQSNMNEKIIVEGECFFEKGLAFVELHLKNDNDSLYVTRVTINSEIIDKFLIENTSNNTIQP